MNDNKDFMLKRAQNAVLSRDFVLAARLYKTILKQNPKDIEILSQLGSTYVRAGEDEKALDVYNQILKINNTDFNALNNLGGIYRRLKRYEDSVIVLERALATGDNTNEVYYNLGHTYKLMGSYDDAADCFVTVIEENPNDVLAYNHLGSIQAARGEHTKALQSYKRALQIDKNHPILHYNSALSFLALGKIDQAKLSFENALRTRPGWVEAMVDYADLLIGINKNKEAQDLLFQAQKLNPEDINILNALGKLNFKRKNYLMAEQNYQTVLAKNSEDYRALIGMALVYEKQRKLLDSQNLFEKLETFDPDNYDVVLQHSRVLLKLNELEKAFSRINKICQNNPKNCDALNLLAQYYIYVKDETHKNACFKRINDTNPKYVNHLLDCAEVYIDQGDFSSGEVILTQYLTKRRNDTEALMIMASLNEAIHNYSTALQIYRRIFELEPQNANVLETINRISQNISFSDTTEPLPEYLIPDYEIEESYDEDELTQEDDSVDKEDSDEKVILNLDNMADSEELPPEPLEFISETEEESLDFSNMDDKDTVITTLDDLVYNDEPIDINPATENDPLFDEFTPSLDDQLPLVEDEDIIDISNDKGELVFANENPENDFSDNNSESNDGLNQELDSQEDLSSEVGNTPEPKSNFVPQMSNQLPIQNPVNDNSSIRDVDLPLDITPEELTENLEYVEDIEEIEDEDMLSTTKDLSSLVQSLQDALIAKKYENTSELFEVLDELCSYLPDSVKDKYLSSLDKLRLEYLRSKMAGKPGLMSIVEELRKKYPEEFKDFDDSVELTEETILKTFIYMNSLVKELSNKNISSLLSKYLNQAIRMMRD